MAGYWWRENLSRRRRDLFERVTRYSLLATALLQKRDETPSLAPTPRFRWSGSEVAESRWLRKEFSSFDFEPVRKFEFGSKTERTGK